MFIVKVSVSVYDVINLEIYLSFLIKLDNQKTQDKIVNILRKKRAIKTK